MKQALVSATPEGQENEISPTEVAGFGPGYVCATRA